MDRPAFAQEGLCVLCLALALAGCVDDGGAATDGGDAGISDAATDAASAPQAPAAATLPDFLPCAPGWREVPHDDGFTVCEPWPATGREECEAGAVHYPGTPGCVPLGPPCPADGVPADLPSGRPVLHVRAGAVGGTGDLAAPFGTIAEATALAVPGTVIAVAAGAYDEDVTLGAGVALVGACVTGTTITAGTARSDRGVINPEGADVEVRNLTIGPSPRPGLWIVGDGYSATATDLAVVGVRVAGVSVELGAHLDGNRLSVRGVTNPALMTLGRALNVETGATATVRHLDARDNVEFGVVALTGGELDLRDSVVTGTRTPAPDTNGGPGLAVFTGSTLTAERVVVEDNQQVGVVVFDEGSTAELSDAVIRRVAGWGPRGTGRGLNVERGASLGCQRCLVADSRELAVGVGEATLVLADVLIERVVADDLDKLGAGMAVQTGATATADRVAILDVEDFGIAVGDSGFTASDLVIRRVAPQRSDQWFGRALDFQDASTISVRRVEASALHEVGVIVSGARTAVAMEDVRITGVASRPDGFRGDGVIVQDGAALTLSRAHVEAVNEAAVMAHQDAVLTMTDLVVRGVGPQDCWDGLCSAYPGGHGLGAYHSRVTVTRFLVDGADFCGLHVADEGEFFLTDGVVRGTAIGACVQSDAQDLGGLGRSVDYVDNGANLEATMLPVPEPLATTE